MFVINECIRVSARHIYLALTNTGLKYRFVKSSYMNKDVTNNDLSTSKILESTDP